MAVPPPIEMNPDGFHARYRVTKADGTPCDPGAIYFVMRLDNNGSDLKHIKACRAGIIKYCDEMDGHLPQLCDELRALIRLLER